MTSIDELFKGAPGAGTKRKLDAVQDPRELYERSKRNGHPADRGAGQSAAVEDEASGSDGAEGPELPPDFEDDADGEDEDGRFFGGGVNRETARAIAFLDQVDGEEEIKEEEITPAYLRKLALSFEKKLSKNAELRARYPDDPQKYITSEADLDGEVKSLSILSDYPELYSEFVRLHCTASLTSLLQHENTDIAIDAAEIVAELIDDDVFNANPEAWTTLVEALLEADVLDLLLSNLARLDEIQEADRAGATHVLNALSALASRPPSALPLAQHQAIMKWLIERAGQPDRSGAKVQNTQGAAECLAILLQSSLVARRAFVAAEGMDMCLQRLAVYRRQDAPHDSDEDEYAANILAVLIHALDTSHGPKAFLELEGIELGVLLLNSAGKNTRARAIRLLDHALASPHANLTIKATRDGLHSKSKQQTDAGAGSEVAMQLATRLVEAAGLKPVFAILRKAKDAQSLEHALAVIASLLRFLPADSEARIRLLAKFVEKEYGVLDRLVALRRRYVTALASADTAPQGTGGEDGEEDEEEDELEAERRGAHRYALRVVDRILAWTAAEDVGMGAQTSKLLAERDEGLADVLRGIQGQVGELDDADRDEESGELERDDERERRELLRAERAGTREMLNALVASLG